MFRFQICPHCLIAGAMVMACTTFAQAQRPEQQLKAMGIVLPTPSKPVGIYKRAVVSGNLIHLAGHVPIDDEGKIIQGRVGDSMSVDQARGAARRAGMSMLATLRGELGSLDRVERLVKTVGMVNCSAEFTEQPSVVNGCSELFREVFGEEKGVGARSAVGMYALPKGAVVEIEAIFEIKSD